MDDGSQFPADADYLLAAGRAFFNFTYLEAIVIGSLANCTRMAPAQFPPARLLALS